MDDEAKHNSTRDLRRQLPSATAQARRPRGVSAGLQGPAESATTAEHSNVPLPSRTDSFDTPDCIVSASHACTASPVKRAPRLTVPADQSSFRSASRPASLVAMDAKTAPRASVSSTLSGQERSSGNGVMVCSVSTIDRPTSKSSSESQPNGSLRRPFSPSKPQLQLNPGHKRTATGDVKTAGSGPRAPMPPVNGFSHHARTMSADSTGSRIAELSAQIRARLSYAAAKVEQGWQARDGDSTSPTSVLSTVANSKNMRPTARQMYNGSPEGTTVSAPESVRPYNSNVTNKADNLRSSLPPQITPLHMQDIPKLAPPADIVTTNGGLPPRRRPNPNEIPAPNYNPYPRHRRHYSEQEARATTLGSGKKMIPGTPPLTSSQSRPRMQAYTPTLSTRSPVKQRTPSQNALMEQDAIETLLFMSSPENSGYHPNSQPRQSDISVSLEAQMASTMDVGTHSSQGSTTSRPRPMRKVEFLDHSMTSHANPSGLGSHPVGFEAQAGDEIDRLLDQMERDGGHSNSDGETHLNSYDFTGFGEHASAAGWD